MAEDKCKFWLGYPQRPAYLYRSEQYHGSDARSHLSRLPLRQCGVQDGLGAVAADVAHGNEEHPATKQANVNEDNKPWLIRCLLISGRQFYAASIILFCLIAFRN